MAVFTSLASAAEADGRLRNAAFYHRAAEFLVDPADPAKVPLYRRFRETFDAGFASEEIERHLIPYGDGFLSAARLVPRGPARGTVVIHGGFDSFIEEFFCFWRYFRELGYEVVAFDGPGQGATHRLHGVPHDHDWEKPVGRVLDHFQLSEVTLLGISFGGYWCVRAAAFDRSPGSPLTTFSRRTPRPRFPAMDVGHGASWPGDPDRTALVPVLRHTVRNCIPRSCSRDGGCALVASE